MIIKKKIVKLDASYCDILNAALRYNIVKLIFKNRYQNIKYGK